MTFQSSQNAHEGVSAGFFYMKKRRIQLRHLRVPHTTAFSQLFGIFQYRGFFRSPPKCRKFFASSNSSFSRIYDRLLGGLLKKTTQRNRDIFNQIWNLWLLKTHPPFFPQKKVHRVHRCFFWPSGRYTFHRFFQLAKDSEIGRGSRKLKLFCRLSLYL